MRTQQPPAAQRRRQRPHQQPQRHMEDKQQQQQPLTTIAPGRRLLEVTSRKAGSHFAQQTPPTYTSLAGVGVAAQAYSPHQQWVVLRSLETNTFVSVEPPPHADAMIVHGRGESISLNNVFGLLRGGLIWSKSIDSLLNICSTKDEVCTGYLEKESDPHLKRLEVPVETSHFEFRAVTVPPSPPPR